MHEEFLDTYDRSEDFLDAFVKKYKSFLDPRSFDKAVEWRSAASMLTIIGAEYGIQGNANKSMDLLNRALNVVEKGCEKLELRVAKEETYTNAVWFKAMVYENSGDYRLALRLFRYCSFNGTEELKEKCERSIALCTWKLRNRTAIRLLVSGLAIMALSFASDLLMPDLLGPLNSILLWSGAALAVVFLLLYRSRFNR